MHTYSDKHTDIQRHTYIYAHVLNSDKNTTNKVKIELIF